MAKLPALPYVRSGVSEGKSANQAYREFQETADNEGLQGMRRQDFLRLYSETRSLRADAMEAMQAPKESIPEHISERHTERASGYGSWVAIYQRTIGESDLIKLPFLIKSSQPITPEEAEARALAYLDKNPDEYDRRTLGVQYVGTERFTPRV